MKNKKNEISVCMSSYNGEKWIFDQMESIYQQTTVPDEVIIKDDCSTDNTVNVVRKFITDRKLENSWVLIQNSENIGWKRNFMECLQLASGDIIFLCDQDDIWVPSKVENVTNHFNSSEAFLLVSNYLPFSDDGSSTYCFQPSLGKEEMTHIKADIHFDEIRRPGCTFAFRKELIPIANRIWNEKMAHDYALWLAAIVTDKLYSINVPLIRYRRHICNNTPSNEKTRDNRLYKVISRETTLKFLLCQKEALGISDEITKIIENKLRFIENRRELLEDFGVLNSLKMIRYISYYPKPNAFLGDVLSSVRK